jgi:hypothetical protein
MVPRSAFWRRPAATVVVAFLLGAADVWAADAKDKLPQAKSQEKPVVVERKEAPRDSSAGASKSDRFIDKDHNGVDDRREPKVIRPETTQAPPAVKPKPQPPSQQGSAKAPPRN